LVRLKSLLLLPLILFSLFIYIVSDTFVYAHLFDCAGSEAIASGVYAEKIKTARKLFTKPLDFPEPEYYVKSTQCYNAWSLGTEKVIVSESVIQNFTPEELAGILSHELAHTRTHIQNEYPSHWEIDVMGARLTSKKIMLKKLVRMLNEYDNLYEDNKLLMYAFPFSYSTYIAIRNDYLFRIDMVNTYLK